MNIKDLSNTELVKQYKIAKLKFIKATEGTPDESEAERIYDELFKELNNRDIDLRNYYIGSEE